MQASHWTYIFDIVNYVDVAFCISLALLACCGASFVQHSLISGNTVKTFVLGCLVSCCDTVGCCLCGFRGFFPLWGATPDHISCPWAVARVRFISRTSIEDDEWAVFALLLTLQTQQRLTHIDMNRVAHTHTRTPAKSRTQSENLWNKCRCLKWSETF